MIKRKLQKGDYVRLSRSEKDMYQVDWCAISLILVDKKGNKFSARHCDVIYVPPEQAMLWVLEKR